jgi:His/Glu/Gln/Arg/opine family amino acid ABC transporter permease subunit
MDMFLTVLAGLPLTLLVTVGALAVGTVLAIPVTFGLRVPFVPIRIACRVFVDVVRGVPQLVWLFLIYYGVTVGGMRFDALPAGILALGIVASGYLAEIFRGSLKGVHAGQWEAAQALGFGRVTMWGQIVAPQTARIALPGYTNYTIALLKDSAIVSTIGVAEMAARSGQLAKTSDAGIYVFLLAAAIYIALSIPLGILSRRLDIRLRTAVAR